MENKFKMDPVKSKKIKINDKILRKKLIIYKLEEEIRIEEELLLQLEINCIHNWFNNIFTKWLIGYL